MDNYSIIDIHTHIYKQKVAAKAVDAIGEFYELAMDGDGTSEGLIAEAHGCVDKFVVHSASTCPRQVRSINQFIVDECAKHPEFIGFGTFHVAMDDPLAEIEWILEHGLRGVKLHPDFQKFDIDDPRAIELYRAMAGKLILLVHVGDKRYTFSEPEKLRHVIDLVPELTIIAAHMGGYSVWDRAKKCLVGQNLYFDTSSSLFAMSPEEAAEMMRMHGVDRILFGTDFPMWTFDDEYARFMSLPLSDEERKAILGNNAKRLLAI